MPAKTMRIEPSRFSDDCAVVALSIYLGKPYEDVLETARCLIRPWRDNGGLTTRQIQAVGAKFKARLRTKKNADWQLDYGILVMRQPHVVVLRNGLVFDSDASVWDLNHYLAHFDYKIDRLLTDQPR